MLNTNVHSANESNEARDSMPRDSSILDGGYNLKLTIVFVSGHRSLCVQFMGKSYFL